MKWELLDDEDDDDEDDNDEDKLISVTCMSGLCGYRVEGYPCLNGGTPTTHFYLGRNLLRCVCPDQFLGRLCQVPNKMVQRGGDSSLWNFRVNMQSP